MTARLKWIALLVTTLVGLCLMFALAEGAVRLRAHYKYGMATSIESIYRVDASTGLRLLVPQARTQRISVNSLGFRGPEIPQRKPEGRVRIAFLGASTNFCAEVSGDEQVWPHIVIEQLRRRFPGVEFDYVNAGVPGYSVESSLKNFDHFVKPLQPDLAVIYHATNDLSYEARKLALKRGVIQDTRPEKPTWLERHSLLVELAVKNVRILSAQQGSESVQGRLSVDGESWGVEFGQDLKRLIDAVRSSGATPAIATFSTRIRAEQSTEDKKRAAVSALVYMPFMTLDGLVAGYSRYNQVIREVAKEKDAWLIGGENDIPGDAANFFDTVHFTDAGSRAMADRVAAALGADARFAALIASRRAAPARQ